MLEHGRQDHPEHAGRLQAILDAIEQSPFKAFLHTKCERLATQEELCMAHDEEYVRYILSLDGVELALDAETHITAHSVTAARVAAALSVELVERIVQGQVYSRGFALIRPPGHHAGIRSAMGYCIFNNVALAAKRACQLGLSRVAIVDWDVHMGNGTMEIVRGDARILCIDVHEEQLFPKDVDYSALASKELFLVPLARGAGDIEYLDAFKTRVLPRLRQFQPQLVLVSAGFDAHESDPMGGMYVTTQGFMDLTKLVLSSCPKVAFFLEGGYNSFFLAQNVIGCLHAAGCEN